MKRRLGAKKAIEWRHALSAPTGPGIFGTPSKLAFRWIRGPAGWQKSPVGPEAYNLEVPDEEVNDDCPGHLMEPQDAVQRMWARKPGAEDHFVSQAALGDQGDTEMEADFWANLWQEMGDMIVRSSP